MIIISYLRYKILEGCTVLLNIILDINTNVK